MTGPIIVIAAVALTHRCRGRLQSTWRRTLFFLTVLSFGVILQVTLLREPPRGTCLSRLTDWGLDRPSSGQLGVETLLKIVLFMPLGMHATLLWKTPF